MGHERYCPRPVSAVAGEPFESVEDAWFWSVQGVVARLEGARVVAGLAGVMRPCEPSDVIRLVSRLRREQHLQRRHLHVLMRYGRRLAAPDATRHNEYRDARLWDEALDRIAGSLRERGIVV